MKIARPANDERSDIDHNALSAVASAEKRKSEKLSKCQLISCRVAGKTFSYFVFRMIFIYPAGHRKRACVYWKKH